MSSLSSPISAEQAAYRRAHMFDFRICSIDAAKTRSRRDDRLWLAASVAVADIPPITVVKKLGDHSAVLFDPGVVVRNVFVEMDSAAVFAYILVHNENAAEGDVLKVMEMGASRIATAGAVAAGAVISKMTCPEITSAVTDAVQTSTGSAIGTEIMPLCGSALDALAGSLMRQGIAITNLDCDGPVAAKVQVLLGSNLQKKVKASHPYSQTDEHHGVEPPSHGETSHYFVTWVVTRPQHFYPSPTSTSLASAVGDNTHNWIYYIGADSEIYELAWINEIWTNGQILKSARTTPASPAARQGSPLTCWNQKSYGPRIFYIDETNNVTGIYRNGVGKNYGSLFYASHQKLGTAAQGSGLVCCGVKDGASKVYFVDSTNRLSEVTLQGDKWNLNPLPGTPRAGGTPLACVGFGARHSRVYYVDNNGCINETAHAGTSWVTSVLPGGQVDARSELTCYGFSKMGDPSSIRVYYIDTNDCIIELAWSKGTWTKGHWSNNLLPGTASPDCGALTCYMVDSTESRVYYLNRQNRVSELAWVDGRWEEKVLPAREATPSTSLTCCANSAGSDPRVYYLDVNYVINEIAWSDGRWESSIVASC